MIDLKNIHIGSLIEQKVIERNLKIERITVFLKSAESEIQSMYKSKSIDAEVLLKWSKLLEYDFFRLYTQHLILYAPPASPTFSPTKTTSKFPQFRKNIYTR